jgi:hypothetical protein
MRLKVSEIISSANSLSTIGSVKVNTALKFRLARIIKQVQKVLADVEQAKKSLIEEKGGVLPEGQTTYKFPSAEIEKEVVKEIEGLADEEVEIHFDKFSEDTFEKLEINSIDIANCLWLFAEPDKKSETPAEKDATV